MCNLGTQQEKDREDVMHGVTILFGIMKQSYNIVRLEDAVDIL